ncbi:hypothetical protein GCM10023065_13190 [Microbacterium laevaniformans]|uniref:DUF2218 domain-containing protein n=1 Tax=Microbacterium laevaniformans TaxID=36807 RepID=A0A150HHA2_9MICO|nr:DUF2218 domain-containing protein [Microbacterium laevaniformans]KXZ61415.1 hypothetical protein Mlaev_00412 [Microbacterium laevaniformans]MBM7752267.1 hypothetical protein [Microbacterium laevaniformans]GLJ64677.1 hypothetical protein GCM10017578_15660 [Microbacterium laevaniformans]
MLFAEAHIPTDRASRYLVQLCRHLGQMRGMPHGSLASHGGQMPPAVQEVDWSETAGTIRFDRGTCTLWATSDMLTVRIQAEDADALGRLRSGIGRRVETIGRRDRLKVDWAPSSEEPHPRVDTHGDDSGALPAGPAASERARQSPRKTPLLVLAAIAAAAVIVHLGLLGASVVASAWARWGAAALAVIILGTIVAVGLHVTVGGVAFRHRGKIGHWARGHGVAMENPRHRPTDPNDRRPQGQCEAAWGWGCPYRCGSASKVSAQLSEQK